ncbi:MAG: transcription-repair coupling factor [Clostridia bacterium]|nr:transcription-repair coupling factor [Clostridia bacterium]
MNTEILLSSIKGANEYKELTSSLSDLKSRGESLPLLVNGVSGGSFYALSYSLIEHLKKEYKKTVLLLVAEQRDASRLNDFLIKSGLNTAFYPFRDFNFYDMTSSRELEYDRLRILCGVSDSSIDAVITTPDALLQYTMPSSHLKKRTFKVDKSSTVDITELSSRLIDTGYQLSEIVESAGQFAVRGGIIDIFPTGNGDFTLNGEKRENLPIRIELFGDEIDRMGVFDPLTQRMKESIDSFSITPSKEIIVNDSDKDKILEIIDTLLDKCENESAKAELMRERFSLSNGISSSFFDKFISIIYPEKECLLDYFKDTPCAVFADLASIRQKAETALELSYENGRSLIESGLLTSEYASFMGDISLMEDFYEKNQVIFLDKYFVSYKGKCGGVFDFKVKGLSLRDGSLNFAVDELKSLVSNGYSCVLVCRTETELKGAVKTLNEYSVPAFAYKDGDTLRTGAVCALCDYFPEGYELPLSKFALAVLSSRTDKLNVKTKKTKKFAKNAGERILSYADLNEGDYVVHASYGIGRYTGIKNLCALGAYRDYVTIEYAGTDKLFLPVDQLDMVSKYIGAKGEDGQVKLSKMGGAEWKRATAKTKAAVKDMAKELIDLYARRQRINGFAFMPDGILEREFDSSFEFDETDCQREAIDEIKADMERPYPMDRVLCGDVGYGKTEVALRAAMKAVANNKQVAILVPTTILCMQHYQTALSRFAGTGVNIEMISRFVTPSNQSRVLRKLRRGDVDIIIGTHKLLSGNVEFKDLGLLIIDEEQRFGVAQKEKIKKLCPDVDVLSLSATPIPRTLSMAIGGIRDMSVLDEAPGGRQGVQSYVLEYDENILNDAIRRELHRGGQVFYLFNNVEYVYRIADRLKKAFPDARIRVAHGQMDREDIENIWAELVKGEIDILVSTTIIETGIDIPNANTLIIENADKMGLSQLHQIRGRVGRSHRRAYAYFTFRQGKALTEIAQKRLDAIRDFAEFGAGFKIAMRDLEIRGAGNLLGAAQHGHMEAVGYDLYVKLLNEAVLEEKGERIPEKFESVISLSSDAFLPESYIRSSAQRMEIYKKIAHIENDEDYKDIIEELTDRFGKIPKSAMTLIHTALVKAFASKARMKRVEQMRDQIRFYPEKIDMGVLYLMSKVDMSKIKIMGVGKNPFICLMTKSGDHLLTGAKELLETYIEKFKESGATL